MAEKDGGIPIHNKINPFTSTMYLHFLKKEQLSFLGKLNLSEGSIREANNSKETIPTGKEGKKLT